MVVVDAIKPDRQLPPQAVLSVRALDHHGQLLEGNSEWDFEMSSCDQQKSVHGLAAWHPHQLCSISSPIARGASGATRAEASVHWAQGAETHPRLDPG